MAFTRVAALLHAALSDVVATQHHTATVGGDLNLADLAVRAHADLSDSPADAHHAQAHNLDTHAARAHADLSDAPASAHHSAALLSTVANALRTAAASTGDVSYTGAGFAPSAVLITCIGTDSLDNMSWGHGDDADAERLIAVNTMGGTPGMSLNTTRIAIGDGGSGNFQLAVLKTLDADGITLSWTKGGNGEATSLQITYLR